MTFHFVTNSKQLLRAFSTAAVVFLALQLPAFGALKAGAPFADAVAVWHMVDLHDSAGADSVLIQQGDVKVGVELSGKEREDSLRRGGDGKAAEFRGGWFGAGQGSNSELNVSGTALSICVRLRDPSGKWDTPLFSKHGGHGRLSYNLFATALRGRMSLGFELGTDFKSQPLQLGFPVERMDATAWHDMIVRYSGHRLEMFIDGVLVDEEWPAGKLRLAETVACFLGAEVGADNTVKGGFRGLIDHAALWPRALSDEEIVFLSGGSAVATRNRQAMLGTEDLQVKNFWKPRGELAVGDCMPFYDGQRWHLYYLVDRRGHRSKWGLGAHQWAHVSTADLREWKEHPMAVPITDSQEGSICTGSVFLQNGEYRAYYAVRTIDGSPAPLGVAVSRDGIHFTKSDWAQTLTAIYTGSSARDPHVFQDPRDKTYHMLVTTSQADKKGLERGCLAHLVSTDGRKWEQRAPFFVPGLPGEPECAEWFEWQGMYYLVFSNGGIARYRMSREPLGPWSAPVVSAFDGNQCNVMKSAPFREGRRIGAAFLPRVGGGYAGNLLFREILRQPDGTLATCFVPELMPKTGDVVNLKAGGTKSSLAQLFVVQTTGGVGVMAFTGAPRNLHIAVKLRAAETTKVFGLGLGAIGETNQRAEIRFVPAQGRIEVARGAVLQQVDSLQSDLKLELYLKDDMLDLCLNGRRTLSSRVPNRTGDGLSFFSEGGELRVEGLEVKALLE